jgi:hypothetical protein
VNCPPLDPCFCDLRLVSIELVDATDSIINFQPDCKSAKTIINTCCVGAGCGLRYRLTFNTKIATNELVETAYEAYEASKCLDGCVSIADDHYWLVSNPTMRPKLMGKNWFFSSPPKIGDIVNSPDFDHNIYELEFTLESY